MDHANEEITFTVKRLRYGGMNLLANGEIIAAGGVGAIAAGSSRYLRETLKVNDEED